jgi:hypothetical protein
MPILHQLCAPVMPFLGGFTPLGGTIDAACEAKRLEAWRGVRQHAAKGVIVEALRDGAVVDADDEANRVAHLASLVNQERYFAPKKSAHKISHHTQQS